MRTRRKFEMEELQFKILSFDKSASEFQTTIGRFDPFVSNSMTTAEAESWVGKTVQATGFFTGCFLTNERSALVEVIIQEEELNAASH